MARKKRVGERGEAGVRESESETERTVERERERVMELMELYSL